MSGKLEEFKGFIKEHPLLKEEVKNKKTTWQEIYEQWYLEDNLDNWNRYKENNNKELKEDNMNNNSTDDMLKTVMNYVKKLDTNTINKSIDSIQKVITLMSTFSNSGIGKKEINKDVRDPLFDKKYDDWY